MDTRLRDAYIHLSNLNADIIDNMNAIFENGDEKKGMEEYKNACLNAIALTALIHQMYPELSDDYNINIIKLLEIDEDEFKRFIDMQINATDLLSQELKTQREDHS